VQEYRGDERRGFLDAGLVLGGHARGLAAAVLLDAFIVRTILVPAVMYLSGRANWWLPGWLDRILPHLSIEPATEPSAELSPAPAKEVTRSPTAS
jgi:RND superfamily putative drug exporter